MLHTILKYMLFDSLLSTGVVVHMVTLQFGVFNGFEKNRAFVEQRIYGETFHEAETLLLTILGYFSKVFDFFLLLRSY